MVEQLQSSLELVARPQIAPWLAAPVPAFVLGADARTVRFLNAAAARAFRITHADTCLGKPVPLDEQVLRHLTRIAAMPAGLRQPVERIRYYRGIKPVMVAFQFQPLPRIPHDGGDGEALFLLTLPDISPASDDTGLQATLDLYGGADRLITVFDRDDILAVSGDHSVLDDAHDDIESLLERADADSVVTNQVTTPGGVRPVLILRIGEPTSARRRLFVGPPAEPAVTAEADSAAEAASVSPDPAPVAAAVEPVPVEATPAPMPVEDALAQVAIATQADAPSLPSPVADGGPLAVAVAQMAESLDPAPFVFAPSPRPQRFAWQMDADCRFTQVSGDLAAALGPHAGTIIGRTWQDLADSLGLDPEGRVTRVLTTTTPWHGVTVLWPVEGSALRVPVDLAGMPQLGNDRTLAGVRGFGVVNTGRAVHDPLETGLQLAMPAPAPVEMEPAITAPEVEPVAAIVDPPAQAIEPEPAALEARDEIAEALPVYVAPPVEDVSALPVDLEPPQAVIEAQSAVSQPLPADAAPRIDATHDNIAGLPEAPAISAAEIAQAVAGVGRPKLFDPDPEPLIEPVGVDPGTAARLAYLEALGVEGPSLPGTGSAPLRTIGPPVADWAEPGVRRSTNFDANIASMLPSTRISPETLRLSGAERNAFRQIAEALGARFEGDDEQVQPVSTPSDTPLTALAVERLAGPSAATETRLIDRLPIAVGIVREDCFAHVNDAFLKLTGYSDIDDLNGRGGLDALFAGPHAAKGWQSEGTSRPIPLISREGRVMPVEARIASVPWQGSNGLLVTLVPSVQPAPEAPQAGIATTEAAGSERIAELEAIVDTATDGVLMLEPNGLILSANRAAETLFGVARAELTGRSLQHLLAPESRRSVTDTLERLTRNRDATQPRDGQEVIALVQPEGLLPLVLAAARIDRGENARLCVVLRDISHWKKSEAELTGARRRAEEASVHKSELLAKISHEIRTPLNAIIGFSEVMLGERFGLIGNDRYKDYLRDIHASGALIMSLVNDLLDLSKVEAGKLDLKFESVALTDLMAECVALMQPQANRDRIIIRASLAAGLPNVVADQRSIRQIMLNLVSNAIKFTPAGGQVIVSAAQEDSGEVVIRVRDTGYGMTETEIQMAMEPFRQLHTGRGKGGGTGLGLPLTKALVEANRALLRIESAVNQGTLAQVTFPVGRLALSKAGE